MPRRERPKDTRPYIRDAVRGEPTSVETAAAAGGMVLLAIAVGFVVGFLVVLVMHLSTWLTGLVWGGYLDGDLGFVWYPLVVCLIGGLAIGLWTHFSQDRIEPLQAVMAEFKETGTYRVKPAKSVVSFLLPLVFGGSIGFEAGLTGLITAGCCWIRDKLKTAGLRAASVADVTIAACLSAIFGAPLAGIVAGAESSPDDGSAVLEDPDPSRYNMRRSSKAVLYTAAAFGAFAGIKAFAGIFGTSAGMPHFPAIEAQGAQLLWMLVALVVAYGLIWVYYGSQLLFSRVGSRFGEGMVADIAKPVIAGLVLGALACAFPYIMFPGEEQSHMLMETWASWTALALIGTGVLKAFVTPMCVKMGWIGGNFFPSIFAGVACGYGFALLTGADPMLFVTVIVTAFLAGVVRAPLLTVAIMFLVFPLESVVWMGLAAVIGAALPIPAVLLNSGSE